MFKNVSVLTNSYAVNINGKHHSVSRYLWNMYSEGLGTGDQHSLMIREAQDSCDKKRERERGRRCQPLSSQAVFHLENFFLLIYLFPLQVLKMGKKMA